VFLVDVNFIFILLLLFRTATLGDGTLLGVLVLAPLEVGNTVLHYRSSQLIFFNSLVIFISFSDLSALFAYRGAYATSPSPCVFTRLGVNVISL
jgi:hypothetical protein